MGLELFVEGVDRVAVSLVALHHLDEASVIRATGQKAVDLVGVGEPDLAVEAVLGRGPPLTLSERSLWVQALTPSRSVRRGRRHPHRSHRRSIRETLGRRAATRPSNARADDAAASRSATRPSMAWTKSSTSAPLVPIVIIVPGRTPRNWPFTPSVRSGTVRGSGVTYSSVGHDLARGREQREHSDGEEVEERPTPEVSVDEDEASVEGHVASTIVRWTRARQQGVRPRAGRASPESAEPTRTGALRAIAASTARTCHGAIRGWAPTIRATWPVTTAAAKLLPVVRRSVRRDHATSTSMPAAPHSAGPAGLHHDPLAVGARRAGDREDAGELAGDRPLALVVHRRRRGSIPAKVARSTRSQKVSR